MLKSQRSPRLGTSASPLRRWLERVLLKHPEYAYAVLYDKKNNLLVSRMQPGRDQDQAFSGFTQEDINTLAAWLPTEASGTAQFAPQRFFGASW